MSHLPAFPTFAQFQTIARQFPNSFQLYDLNIVKNLDYLVPSQSSSSSTSTVSPIPESPFLPKAPATQSITKGIRDSLEKTFIQCKNRNITALIPDDVYPVYKVIAEKVGIPFKMFSLKNSIDSITCLTEKNVLIIVPNPNFPYGRYFDDKEVSLINSWLESDNRFLFVDSVYDFVSKKASFIPEKTFHASSVAKTHFLPQSFGYLQHPKDFIFDDQSEVDPKTLSEIQTRDSLLARLLPRFSQSWDDLSKLAPKIYKLALEEQNSSSKHNSSTFSFGNSSAFHSSKNPFQASKVSPNSTVAHFSSTHSQTISPFSFKSYFTVVSQDYRELLDKHNVLASPISILGAQQPKSIISTLSLISSNDLDMYHVIPKKNFIRGYQKYSQSYSKENLPESTFPDKFHLLYRDEIDYGFSKVNQNHTNPDPIILSTRLTPEERENLIPSESGIAQYLKQNSISLSSVYDSNFQPLVIEELTAQSIKLNHELAPYDALYPRSVSILPIAQGCQAKCPFCFSHASISDEQSQKNVLKNLETFKKILAKAKEKGSIRGVITGGGEPGLLPHHVLNTLIKSSAELFNETTVISNGYMLGSQSEENRLKMLKDYLKSGLNVLALSRHGIDSEMNKSIMFLDTGSDKVAQTVSDHNLDILLRWICVLQKGGVENMETIEKYMDFVIASGVEQVCFKELYVSTSIESVYHDNESNLWSLQNQVPLSLVTNFAKKYDLKVLEKLPWGAPIFAGLYKGKYVQVAAYTEPSVYWERANKIARSWNILADGKCYVSLEDKSSLIEPLKS